MGKMSSNSNDSCYSSKLKMDTVKSWLQGPYVSKSHGCHEFMHSMQDVYHISECNRLLGDYQVELSNNSE